MTQLVAVAYNQQPQRAGGPSWLGWTLRGQAKTSPTASKADIQLMLQSLLKQSSASSFIQTARRAFVLGAGHGNSKLKGIGWHRRFRVASNSRFQAITPDVISAGC